MGDTVPEPRNVVNPTLSLEPVSAEPSFKTAPQSQTTAVPPTKATPQITPSAVTTCSAASKVPSTLATSAKESGSKEKEAEKSKKRQRSSSPDIFDVEDPVVQPKKVASVETTRKNPQPKPGTSSSGSSKPRTLTDFWSRPPTKKSSDLNVQDDALLSSFRNGTPVTSTPAEKRKIAETEDLFSLPADENPKRSRRQSEESDGEAMASSRGDLFARRDERDGGSGGSRRGRLAGRGEAVFKAPLPPPVYHPPPLLNVGEFIDMSFKKDAVSGEEDTLSTTVIMMSLVTLEYSRPPLSVSTSVCGLANVKVFKKQTVAQPNCSVILEDRRGDLSTV